MDHVGMTAMPVPRVGLGLTLQPLAEPWLRRGSPGFVHAGRCAILIMLVVGSWSCSVERIGAGDDGSAPFLDHPNPAVAFPARIGGIIGCLVGVPLMVAALPVTIPIASAMDKDMVPVAPLLWSAAGFSTIVGAAMWPFFGWWKVADGAQDAPTGSTPKR